MRAVALAILAAGLGASALAADRDFDAVVKSFEARYGIRRTRVPLFGMVNFFVKVARPAGTKDMKLAIFEDLPIIDAEVDGPNLLAGTLGPEWKPFVRVHSRRDNETVTIYAKMAGKDMRILMAVLEPREAVIMQLKVNKKALQRWFEDPVRMGRHRGNNHD